LRRSVKCGLRSAIAATPATGPDLRVRAYSISRILLLMNRGLLARWRGISHARWAIAVAAAVIPGGCDDTPPNVTAEQEQREPPGDASGGTNDIQAPERPTKIVSTP
jgi:hypothetical protein